jgi:hypothetical protein
MPRIVEVALFLLVIDTVPKCDHTISRSILSLPQPLFEHTLYKKKKIFIKIVLYNYTVKDLAQF